MSRNSLSYEGRIVDNAGQREFGKFTPNGLSVLKLVIAEQHQAKNEKAPKKYQDPQKAADDYVDTTVSWHRITLFGEQAEELAQDDEIARGALVVVTDAAYTEEDPWLDKAKVYRAGRPETLNKGGKIEILERGGHRFGPKDEYAIAAWDGISDIPIIKGSGNGGGAAQGRDYGSDTEGI